MRDADGDTDSTAGDETFLSLEGTKLGESAHRFFLFPCNISLSFPRIFGKDRGELAAGELIVALRIDSLSDTLGSETDRYVFLAMLVSQFMDSFCAVSSTASWLRSVITSWLLELPCTTEVVTSSVVETFDALDDGRREISLQRCLT